MILGAVKIGKADMNSPGSRRFESRIVAHLIAESGRHRRRRRATGASHDDPDPDEPRRVHRLHSPAELHRQRCRRFYARVGVEHARKEPDGSFTQLDPTFHDLVLYRTSAEHAYARFRKGDSFVAAGQ